MIKSIKDYTDWCKENGVTMDEMEEFFNNAIRGTVLEAKRRRQK